MIEDPTTQYASPMQQGKPMRGIGFVAVPIVVGIFLAVIYWRNR